MATVFLCEDERLGRQVAVKRLHAESPDDSARRFAREARLGASLNHPNLVSVFDTVADDEGVLIVMEYVRGDTLAGALRRGPLSVSRTMAVVDDVAAALDHAHRHGVVHRDVKPGNVLMRDDGVTKLADLGIAVAADHTRITRSGTVLGTAAYMAPEQVDGGEVGPATDVYSLAAVAFEALTRRRAREERTPVAVAHALATEPPPDLVDAWPDAPPAAAEVLRRAMERDPLERPRSAGELAEELGDALADAPVTRTTRRFERRPEAVGAPAPAPRSRRLGMPGIALIAVFVALAVAAAVGAILDDGDADKGGSRSNAPQAGARSRDQGAAPAPKEKKPKEAKKAATPPPAQDDQAPPPATEPPPAAEPPANPDGAALNQQGFDLMQAGRYEEAIPILQRAVDSLQGTGDLDFAYALYNLGRSLRLAGRPDEAIPVLEQRLRIPNQTGVVRRELEAARREAG
jgi:serine/threonine-protein kinase